jgi:hypothetical protein
LGFSGLLGLSSPDMQTPLLHWLVSHFDVQSRTMNLPNGFSLTINAKCVYKILSIPYGAIPIIKKATLQAYKIMKT